MNDPVIQEVTFTGRSAQDVANVQAIDLPQVDDPGALPAFHGDNDPSMGQPPPFEQHELAGGWRPDGRYFEVTLPHTIHYKCIGRLANDFGQSSGALIGPNLVLTAGHCVMKGGSNGPIYPNQYFQAGYPRGALVRITRIAVHPWWAKGGQYQGDIAIGLLEDAISPDLWFGVKCNLGVADSHATYGYPGRPPFDSHKCIGDSGEATNKPWEPTGHGPSPLRFNLDAIGTIDLTPGCSGGPWVGDKMKQGVVPRESNPKGRPGSGLYITGLNSMNFKKFPGIMVSPYFGSDIADFVRKAVSSLT